MLHLSRAFVRTIKTTNARQASAAKNEIPKGYFEIKKLQEHFQKDDGKPVFLKGSAMDQVLYRLTVVVAFVAMGGIGKLMYQLTNPPTPEYVSSKRCGGNNGGAGGNSGKGSTIPQKLINLQKQFQKKNDLPVFLKGGQKDAILFYGTAGLLGVSLILDAILVGGFVWP